MKTTRLAPGLYHVETPYGIATLDRIERDAWVITYPDGGYSGDVVPTKRMAKEWVESWVEMRTTEGGWA